MRGQRRTDQWPGAGNGSEMVAKQDPFVGRYEVAAVVVTFRRRGARVIKRQNFRGHKSGVQPEGHEITTERGDNKPHRVERFAAMDGNGSESPGAHNCHDQPNQNGEDPLHGGASSPVSPR